MKWVEALDTAVRWIHDTPGEAGMSPYEVLYGRSRPYAGIPYKAPNVMEDAVAFFKRQEEVDEKVARTLQEVHQKKADQVNKSRKELAVLRIGQKVWWLRPRGRTGDKLATYWIGPCVVRGRQGEHSYLVEVEPGRMHEVHRCHLKEHKEDPFGVPLKLFKYKQAVPASTVDKAVRALDLGRQGFENIITEEFWPKESEVGWPKTWEAPPLDWPAEEGGWHPAKGVRLESGAGEVGTEKGRATISHQGKGTGGAKMSLTTGGQGKTRSGPSQQPEAEGRSDS